MSFEKGIKASAPDEERKKSACLYCGEDHDLAQCSHLSDKHLEEIMVQLEVTGDRIEQDAKHSGGMLFQDDVQEVVNTCRLNRDYLYLDTCSTNDQMVNSSFLKRLYKVRKPLMLHTNDGSSRTHQKGYLGSTLFWYGCMGIANIISLKTLEKKCQVKYNSTLYG